MFQIGWAGEKKEMTEKKQRPVGMERRRGNLPIRSGWRIPGREYTMCKEMKESLGLPLVEG